MIQDIRSVRSILGRCKFPNVSFNLTQYNSCIFLQLDCDGIDNVTKQPAKWKSRKWYISKYATESEIVQTAFKALLTAYEHEIRENFTYLEVTVMNPHLDLNKLVEFTGGNNISERE